MAVDPRDSMNPANQRDAEFYSKNHVIQLEDENGDPITFLVKAEYRVNQMGVSVRWFDYWPHDARFRDPIEDWLDRN